LPLASLSTTVFAVFALVLTIVVKALYPLPTSKLPDTNEVAPVPPCGTYNVPTKSVRFNGSDVTYK